MTESIVHALKGAEPRVAQILTLLDRLVAENSYSANVAGVNRVGDMLAEAFSLPGLRLTRHTGNEVGDHLLWTSEAWDAGMDNRVVLIGHHDTVFPPGSFDTLKRDGDRLNGPGVLDMKGGLCTVWAAVAALSDLGLLERVPLAVVSVGDEEIGSMDSAPHLRELAKGASAALVFEAGRPGDLIITQRKGTGVVHIVATGVAAHAGNHHREGKNAIWALARAVERAESLTDYDKQVTVNVGLFSGGEARNTVPGKAQCTIDFRFVRQSDGLAVVSALESACRDISRATGVALAVEGGIRRMPLEESPESLALCESYGQCARLEGLGSGTIGLLGGGSDANTTAAIGVPSIDGLGPRGKGFHTHDEYIEVSSLPLRARALFRFLFERVSH